VGSALTGDTTACPDCFSQKALTSVANDDVTATATTQKALTSVAVAEQDILGRKLPPIGPAQRLYKRERGSPFHSTRSPTFPGAERVAARWNDGFQLAICAAPVDPYQDS